MMKKNKTLVALFATTLCASILSLTTGCQALDGNNYVRSGMFKDRFDHGSYQYIEGGRSQPLTENLFLNIMGGFHTERSSEFDHMNSCVKDYWEANLEYRF